MIEELGFTESPLYGVYIRIELVDYVYPLFATTGVAVGICGMQLLRNISTNSEVRYCH
ncbi:unnamed protein product [Arabis nemorensis]|uniref:Uncharacterized protein n=1 Tax=Arabis nemorensis TaxID=586526 RepID=A0A565CMR1_9BRAS|nr:unnamed protein product [Arabis nemorensis]